MPVSATICSSWSVLKEGGAAGPFPRDPGQWRRENRAPRGCALSCLAWAGHCFLQFGALPELISTPSSAEWVLIRQGSGAGNVPIQCLCPECWSQSSCSISGDFCKGLFFFKFYSKLHEIKVILFLKIKKALINGF